MTQRSRTFLVLLLSLAVLGSYYAMPLFFGIYFLFGNIFVFLIIYIYGLRWGIFAGLLSCIPTIFLWEHYYGILIYPLEACFIAYTWRRYSNNLLLLVVVFWIFIASPIIFLVYLAIPVHSDQFLLSLLKMPFNSVINAALASLFMIYLPLLNWTERHTHVQQLRLPFNQVLINVIVTFVMIPPLFQINVSGQWMFERTEAEIKATLNGLANTTRLELVQQREQYQLALQQLARIAEQYGFESNEFKQHVHAMLSLLPTLLELVTVDETQNTVETTRYPKQGVLSIAQPFYEREHYHNKHEEDFHIYLLKNQHDVMTTYLVHEIIVRDGQQHVVGVIQAYLNLPDLHISSDANNKKVQFSLINQYQQVLYSTRNDITLQRHYDYLPIQENLTSFSKFFLWQGNSKASLENVSLWQNGAQYILLIYGGEDMPFWLAFEMPLENYVQLLRNFYIQEYFFFAIIALLGLGLAVFSTQQLVLPLHKLTHLTRNLALRLEQKQSIAWPRSPVYEVDLLTLHFKAMGEALQERFKDIQTVNQKLEAHVEQRTLELQHERALLKNLINSTSDLIFYKDQQGHYLGCNRAFEQFAGYAENQLLEKKDVDLFNTEKAELLQIGDTVIFNTGLQHVYTHWAHYPDQQIVMLEVIKTPIWDENRQLRGLISVARDITDRHQVEEALRYSQAMLRLVMDNIPQAIFWQDQAGVFLGCNRNFTQFLNLNESDIIGYAETELREQYPQLISLFDALNLSSIHQNKSLPNNTVTAFQRPNEGNLCWLELSYARLFNNEGVVFAYLGCFEDITERRRAEERLRQISKVLENNTEAILITDAKTRILAINRAFTDITGYTEQEALGYTPRDLVFSGQHDDSFYRAMWSSINSLGHWEGEISNCRKNGEIYSEWLHISVIKDEHEQEVTHYLAIFSDITERKKTEARLDYLAHYDSLTGLPNRLFFHRSLSEALLKKNTKNMSGVMLVDLDRFKDINDTWGHNTGDVLLQEVANRLHECVKKPNVIARLGGDDFIIYLEHISQPEMMALQAQAILDAMLPPFFLNGHEVFVTSSIGIALSPTDGEDADTLLKNADAAMYSAKATGKNTYAFFTQQMNVQAHRRVTLESQLRHALERDEFVLHYQPQMHLASGMITGAEVLIRWQHPEQGLISPHLFIPVAEESGLVNQIGEWVLYHACEQHKQWRNHGLPILRIAVNLSSRQFRDHDFSKRVFEIIDSTQMDPTLLELELTESMLMEDAERISGLLQQFKEAQIQLAIDDFGTGYSSLSYLKRFPINRLKVDQSFIRDIPSNKDDMAITRAIVALAHSLHLQVTAEGVETRAQVAFLKTLRCEEIQGYLIGKPMPANDFIQLISGIPFNEAQGS